jgi:hypothetical protein
LPEAERNAAVAALDDTARAGAAALLYAGLQPTPKLRTYIFEWQPFLVRAVELGLVRDDETAAAAASLIVGAAVKPTDVGNCLLAAATYIDDQQWQESTAHELNLAHMEFTNERVSRDYGVMLRVSGVADPLHDPRLVTLVRKTLAYRKARGIIISLPEGRLSVQIGGHLYAKLDGIRYESVEPITLDDLSLLEWNGAGLGALLPKPVEHTSGTY